MSSGELEAHPLTAVKTAFIMVCSRRMVERRASKICNLRLFWYAADEDNCRVSAEAPIVNVPSLETFVFGKYITQQIYRPYSSCIMSLNVHSRWIIRMEIGALGTYKSQFITSIDCLGLLVYTPYCSPWDILLSNIFLVKLSFFLFDCKL